MEKSDISIPFIVVGITLALLVVWSLWFRPYRTRLAAWWMARLSARHKQSYTVHRELCRCHAALAERDRNQADRELYRRLTEDRSFLRERIVAAPLKVVFSQSRYNGPKVCHVVSATFFLSPAPRLVSLQCFYLEEAEKETFFHMIAETEFPEEKRIEPM